MSIATDGRKKRWLWRQLALVALGALLAGRAQAVTISPVILELTPARPVAAVTVSNDSDSPLTLQAETLEWTQPNGEERNTESDALLVVPPFAEIRPGGSQIFRVTLRRPDLAAAERAYRLVLEDVSEIKQPSQGIGVTFRFAHRLPVFVAGTGKSGPKPHLGSCPAPAPSGCVRLDNGGDRFVQVKGMRVEGGGWRKELGGGSRVLAGAWKQWTFDWPVSQAGPLTVHAETSSGPLSIELAAERR